MNNYIIIIRVIFMLMLLSNCSFLDNKKYNVSILEKTCLNQKNFDKKYIGMTKEQIVYMFGHSIISDSFNDAYHYIICTKTEGKIFQQKMLNLYFQDDKVIKFDIQ